MSRKSGLARLGAADVPGKRQVTQTVGPQDSHLDPFAKGERAQQNPRGWGSKLTGHPTPAAAFTATDGRAPARSFGCLEKRYRVSPSTAEIRLISRSDKNDRTGSEYSAVPKLST